MRQLLKKLSIAFPVVIIDAGGGIVDGDVF